MNISVILLIIAIVLLGWSALVAASLVTFGNFYFLLAVGLTIWALSQLPRLNKQI